MVKSNQSKLCECVEGTVASLGYRNRSLSKLSLGGFGSPDLIVTERNLKSGVFDKLSKWMGSTPRTFHFALGCDNSSPASIAGLYVSWLKNSQKNVSSIVYCTYDCFSGTDVRVSVSFPGSVTAKAYNSEGSQIKIDSVPDLFENALVSNFLRAQRASDYRSADFPSLIHMDMLSTLEQEKDILRYVKQRWNQGPKLGHASPTFTATCYDNILIDTILGWFAQKQRFVQARQFVEDLVDFEVPDDVRLVLLARLLRMESRHKDALDLLSTNVDLGERGAKEQQLFRFVVVVEQLRNMDVLETNYSETLDSGFELLDDLDVSVNDSELRLLRARLCVRQTDASKALESLNQIEPSPPEIPILFFVPPYDSLIFTAPLDPESTLPVSLQAFVPSFDSRILEEFKLEETLTFRSEETGTTSHLGLFAHRFDGLGGQNIEQIERLVYSLLVDICSAIGMSNTLTEGWDALSQLKESLNPLSPFLNSMMLCLLDDLLLLTQWKEENEQIAFFEQFQETQKKPTPLRRLGNMSSSLASIVFQRAKKILPGEELKPSREDIETGPVGKPEQDQHDGSDQAESPQTVGENDVKVTGQMDPEIEQPHDQEIKVMESQVESPKIERENDGKLNAYGTEEGPVDDEPAKQLEFADKTEGEPVQNEDSEMKPSRSDTQLSESVDDQIPKSPKSSTPPPNNQLVPDTPLTPDSNVVIDHVESESESEEPAVPPESPIRPKVPSPILRRLRAFLALRLHLIQDAEIELRNVIAIETSVRAYLALLDIYSKRNLVKESLIVCGNLLQLYWPPTSENLSYLSQTLPPTQISSKIYLLIKQNGLQSVRETQDKIGLSHPCINKIMHDVVRWKACGFDQ